LDVCSMKLCNKIIVINSSYIIFPPNEWSARKVALPRTF
jgi:hypothetical protein